jgi:predicted aspartyl protease
VAALVRSLGIALFLLLSAGQIRAVAGNPCALRPRREAELALRRIRGVPLVTATIDGAAAGLILDTGAEETVLTTAAAARLGLRGHYEYPRNLRSVSGGVATGEARLQSFVVGDATAADFIVLVGSLSLPSAEGVQPDGLLGGDFLSRFDVDLDLPDDRLTLYRHGCAPSHPPWEGAYTAVSANRSINDRLFFPVDLDGHRFFAFIDTGAQISTIDTGAARALGISPTTLARDPVAVMRGVAPERIRARVHRFRWLRVGDATIRDPVMVVADLNLPDADIVLGLDFLRGRRVRFSYAARRIFLGSPEAR